MPRYNPKPTAASHQASLSRATIRGAKVFLRTTILLAAPRREFFANMARTIN
jgi:hypothetical protein